MKSIQEKKELFQLSMCWGWNGGSFFIFHCFSERNCDGGVGGWMGKFKLVGWMNWFLSYGCWSSDGAVDDDVDDNDYSPADDASAGYDD